MNETTETSEDINVENIKSDTLREERERMKQLHQLGERYISCKGRELAKEAIIDGSSVAEMKERILQNLPEQPVSKTSEFISGNNNYIGMKDGEIERFSFTKLINALSNPQD